MSEASDLRAELRALTRDYVVLKGVNGDFDDYRRRVQEAADIIDGLESSEWHPQVYRGLGMAVAVLRNKGLI